MSGCRECEIAAREPHHLFRSDCEGCKARSFARSMLFYVAKIKGKLPKAYVDALAASGITHAQVKDAAARDRLLTQEAAQ